MSDVFHENRSILEILMIFSSDYQLKREITMKLTRPKNPMQRMFQLRSVRENQGHPLGRVQPPPLPHPRVRCLRGTNPQMP